MNYNEIKKIIDDMQNSNLDELNIEFTDGTKVSMKKNQNTMINENKNIQNENIIHYESKQEEKEMIKEGNIVKSPMVGTFYSKPSPTSEPFVKIGDNIKKGDTLCILEAMKLMNEIESEYSGEVIEIFIKDGETVEYGTPLFKIK